MMVVRLKILLVILLLCTSATTSFSQKEKDIIARYRAALKKSAQPENVKTIVALGTYSVEKFSYPNTIYFSPKHTRMEVQVQNLLFITVLNDTLQWEYNPGTDEHRFTPIVSKEETGGYSADKAVDFANVDLMNYARLGHKLRLIEKTKLDSVEVYVLELVRKDQVKRKYFLNAKSNLIYKVEHDGGHRYFVKYVTIEGFVFPTNIYQYERGQNAYLVFEKIEFNRPLADSLFIIPQRAFEIDRERKARLIQSLDSADQNIALGKLDEAMKAYNKVLSKEDNYRAFNGRGRVKFLRKQYYESIDDFSRAFNMDSSGNLSVNNRGLSKFFLGDQKGAMDDYTLSLNIAPSVPAYKNRGLLFLRTKKFEEAESDFQKAVDLAPTDGDALLKLGVAQAQLQKYDQALKQYQLARTNKLATAELFNYKGVTEFNLGALDSATSSFKSAYTLEPENLQYLENYGRTLFELKQYEAAAEQFELYLKKKNDHADILNLLGLCKYYDEDYKGAIKTYTKAIEVNPKIARYYDNRALAKEQIEDYEGSLKDLTESIAVYPNNASVFFRRGLIKIKTSKKLEGCQDLSTAYDMKYEGAQEAIMKFCN